VPPKDSSFYDALVCPPPSASVSKDRRYINAVLSYLIFWKVFTVCCRTTRSLACIGMSRQAEPSDG